MDSDLRFNKSTVVRKLWGWHKCWGLLRGETEYTLTWRAFQNMGSRGRAEIRGSCQLVQDWENRSEGEDEGGELPSSLPWNEPLLTESGVEFF